MIYTSIKSTGVKELIQFKNKSIFPCLNKVCMPFKTSALKVFYHIPPVVKKNIKVQIWNDTKQRDV